jgi:hypothetical protein
MAGGGGFNIAGTTGGATNVYAFLPNYPQTGIDDPLLPSAFTREALNHYSQYHHIRWMEAQGAAENTFLCRSNNRRNARNTQANQGNWGRISIYGIGTVISTATAGGATFITDTHQNWKVDQFAGRLVWNPRSGESKRIASNTATSLVFDPMTAANRPGDRYVVCLGKGDSQAELLEPWSALSGTIILTFPDSAYDGISCTVTRGSTSVNLLQSLPSAVTQPFVTGGIEGYPIEWAVSFCKACNVGLWVCLPMFEDGPNGMAGTYSEEVLAYLAKSFSDALPLYLEISNEIWNSGSNVFRAWRFLASKSGLGASEYMGARYHDLANMCRRHFPASFGKSVCHVAAWQCGGGGLNGFAQMLSYMESNYGHVSADVQCMAIAPYADPGYFSCERVTDVTHASSAVITIDSKREVNPLSGGSTVEFKDFAGMRELNGKSATVLAIAGTVGRYSATVDLDTRQFGSFSGGGIVFDSSGTILSKIATSTIGQSFSRSRLSENLAVLALHYGMRLCAYESGIEWNATSNTFRNPQTNPNVADVAMGAPLQAVLEKYYQGLFDAGFSMITHFGGGVSTASEGFGSDELSNDYSTFVARGSPMLAALQQFMRGFVPRRNIVDDKGSVIDGANYADNLDGAFPSLGVSGAYKLGPHVFSNGYVPYLLHCNRPGQYQIELTTTNSNGNAYTDVEVNGQIVRKGVVVSEGKSQLAAITLAQGLNYFVLGTGKATSAQMGCLVRSIAFV